MEWNRIYFLGDQRPGNNYDYHIVVGRTLKKRVKWLKLRLWDPLLKRYTRQRVRVECVYQERNKAILCWAIALTKE